MGLSLGAGEVADVSSCRGSRRSFVEGLLLANRIVVSALNAAVKLPPKTVKEHRSRCF